VDDRRTLSFVTDAPVVEVVGHGYNDAELPPGFDADGERVVVLKRMREANPGALVQLVEGGKWTPYRGPRDFANQHRQASKRVARNRARTKAAHRARMAQKGRK